MAIGTDRHHIASCIRENHGESARPCPEARKSPSRSLIRTAGSHWKGSDRSGHMSRTAMRVCGKSFWKDQRAENGSKEVERSEGVPMMNKQHKRVALDWIELHRTHCDRQTAFGATQNVHSCTRSNLNDQ